MASQHPTREALISTVVNLLDTHEIETITSEQVLEISKISRGSMYHHFDDFSELIEEAQVRRYAGYVDQSIVMLSSMVFDSTDRGSLIAHVREASVITQSEQLMTNRFERMTALAKAVRTPRMQKILGAEQERLNESIADLYRVVLDKGWGNPNLDPRAVAVFIQSYTLGKVVDDVTTDHMQGSDWLNLINTVLESAIFPPSSK